VRDLQAGQRWIYAKARPESLCAQPGSRVVVSHKLLEILHAREVNAVLWAVLIAMMLNGSRLTMHRR